MVKFQVGTVRKRYLNKKRLYEYRRISLNVPHRFHELVEPFLDKEFQMNVTADKNAVTITLTMVSEVSRTARA